MKLNIGYALCGSFCTHDKALKYMRILKDKGHNIIPILSFNSAGIDTRFGTAAQLKEQISLITDNPIIETIEDAEPIGPKQMCDIIIISPCTGNTLGKLSAGITDTPVTMAVKSHLRINRPVVIALCTNDALGASAQNIGKLINTKNVFFVPMHQDDPHRKPHSLVANFDLLEDTMLSALEKAQFQPVF
ncbi:MAG: dipicolinate synthase subunit B [Clostridiales bacterium]|nr:dipicolinate synthase subunit B [Clostridiales bacterium]